MKSKDLLTEREKVFVKTYLESKKPGLAYVTAYNVKDPNPTAVHNRTRGRQLLCKPKIKTIVEAANKEVAVRTEELIVSKYAATKERVIEELARIAFTDYSDLHTWDKDNGIQAADSANIPDDAKGAIIEVNESKGKDGKSKIKIKLADKTRALEGLAKALGLNAPEKHEHKHMAVNFIIERS